MRTAGHPADRTDVAAHHPLDLVVIYVGLPRLSSQSRFQFQTSGRRILTKGRIAWGSNDVFFCCVHRSRDSINHPMLFNGPDNPKKCPIPWGMTTPSNTSFPDGSMHVSHPPNHISNQIKSNQTQIYIARYIASESEALERIIRFCRAHERDQQTDINTDRPRCSVCSNRPHLAIAAMRPIKSQQTIDRAKRLWTVWLNVSNNSPIVVCDQTTYRFRINTGYATRTL